MIVGLNPAPRSVAAGHYYQGPVGQQQITRLVQVAWFQPQRTDWGDRVFRMPAPRRARRLPTRSWRKSPRREN